MSMEIRFVAEYYDPKTGEVIETRILRRDEIQKPETIRELGYLHEEQIDILQSIQDFKIHYESQLINSEASCPECGKKTSLIGKRQSNFHAVFTDHKVSIQRRRCRCNWKSPDTVEKIYGSSLHPDLLEKQVLQGAEHSYCQASNILNAESKKERSINNDDRIRRNIAEVANIIENERRKPYKIVKQNEASKQLVAVMDGGHIKSNKKIGQSFEAMITSVFDPNNIVKVDKQHNEIIKKTSVGSGLSDNQETIKQLSLNACRAEGAHPLVTELTCITDGAKNCWSIANALKPCCKKLINVLDWFHISKRFTIVLNRVDNDMKIRLEKVKWFLWHGNVKNALERLSEIEADIDEGKALSEVQSIYDYISRNQQYIVNYQDRQAANLPFTSTIAESSVNSLINARQKNNKKMQWSREGAHSILQIRTSQFSKTWDKDWERVLAQIYRKAA